MSAKPTRKPSSKTDRPSRGRANLARLRKTSERRIEETSPPELRDLPTGFWDDATLVEPVRKQPISLRVDVDVLDWFKNTGPGYLTRMNSVLRSYYEARRRQ